MKLGIVTAAALALPLIASAALPPQYQRQRELKEIISSSEVEDALESRPIDSVTWVSEDVYRVRAGECTVIANIVSDPMPGDGWAGPRQFHVEAGDVTCVDAETEGVE